jgi:thioesterase domain-containing protein/acyl carrier protein
MVPSFISSLENLPLTPNGKIDRHGLPSVDDLNAGSRSFAPPRTEVERKLADIWTKVLGVGRVGIHDNFFDLGGHSLLAVRLMAEIEKSFGEKIPLVSLFQDATIAALAAILRIGVKGLSWPTVVDIQTNGDRCPLFCVSMPNYNALGYRSLARHLGPDQPVYGLQAQYPEDLRGEHSNAAVNKIAQEYLKALRAVRPHGPYQLLGQCRGAHIAFEMARRLNEDGQVALLGIVDTWVAENTLNVFWRLGFVLRIQTFRLRTELRKLFKRSPQRGRSVSAPSPKRDPVYDLYFPRRSFIPSTYSGRVAVFRTRVQPVERIRDEALGWGRLAPGGVEIHYISGKHSNLLSEPQVQGLAEALNRCLLPAGCAE